MHSMTSVALFHYEIRLFELSENIGIHVPLLTWVAMALMVVALSCRISSALELGALVFL